MLSMLKSRRRLIAENKELKSKNDALLRKNIELRHRLSQAISMRRRVDE